ncbi:MAG: DUF4116 domain-containing protein, partial [Candidatus Peribacteraceae bacterium]|nr:DUF4116 domain-containing protein [Candidatus Peribacteraceae bacterium]
MNAFETGSAGGASRESVRRNILEGTHKGLEGLKMQTDRTRTERDGRENANKAFVTSISGARERIVKGQCLEQLQKTMSGFPETSDWARWLRGLERLATPSDSTMEERITTRPNPVAILRYISQVEPEINREKFSLVGTARAPADEVLAVFRSFRRAIGELHPDAITGNPYAWAGNPDVDRRAANLARTAFFVVTATGALVTGIAAMFSDNPNWKLPAVWALFALLAAGAGDITGSRNDRLGRQIGFLTRPDGSWSKLQQKYDLTGPTWAQFARSLMIEHRDDAALVQARKPRVTLTAEEQDAIVALAPVAIQAKVRLMLQSRAGNRGRHSDFRTFLGLLDRARTEETQDLVTIFIQDGSTAQSVQNMLPAGVPRRTVSAVPEEFPVIAPASGSTVLPDAPVPTSTTVTAPTLTTDPSVIRGGPVTAAERKDVIASLSLMSDTAIGLRSLSDRLRADKDIVLFAVGRAGHALEFASDALKDDIDVVRAALRTARPFAFVSPRLKRDPSIIILLAGVVDRASEIPVEFRNDRQIVLILLRRLKVQLNEIPEAFRNDKAVVLIAVQASGDALQFASLPLKADRDVVLAAVRSFGPSLQYASEALRDDADIVRFAIATSAAAFEFASLRLRGDAVIARQAIESLPGNLRFASGEIPDDRTIVESALRRDAQMLQYASTRLRNDSALVIGAVERDGLLLQFASDTLRDDFIAVSAAIRSPADTVQVFLLASATIRDNEDIILTAIRKDDRIYLSLSEARKNDRALVLRMIDYSLNGGVLQYLPDALKRDEEIVLTAVRGHAQAMQYASDTLRGNKAFVLRALAVNTNILPFILPTLLNDADVIRTALSLNPRALEQLPADVQARC